MLPTLLIILLLEGFITISVEIITIRQLMPFFGNSVIITSIIIGVFLLFLALGYWRGGTNRQDIFKVLSRNFFFSMIWVGIGLSYSFIAVFFYGTVFHLSVPIVLSLTLYLICILAPIVYWLGQTVPLTTNLFNQNKGIAKISGRALFLSTVGSFLGALITSLVLFQYLGVAWTVVINCVLLYALALWLLSYSQLKGWQILLMSFALLLITKFNIDNEKMNFLLTNNYGNYRVMNTNANNKILSINESYSSMITDKKQGFAYIEYIHDLLFKQLNLQNKDILIIGAGGFSLTAAGTNKNQITYVDIDPAIKNIAETYFLQQAINGQFIGQDARQFLSESRNTYDVVVSDVYSHKTTIPPSLLTKEYFQQVSNHLNPNGLFIINIIATSLFNDSFSKRLANTVREVFNYCAIVPLNLNQELGNIIYICPKTNVEKTIYTDDLSTATFDFFNSKAL